MSVIKKENCVLFLTTSQSNDIKTLIDALKEILNNVNLVFKEDGMLIKAIDPANVALVHLKLDANRFHTYHLTVPQLEVGLNMPNLHKFTKQIKKDDVLTLFVERDNIGELGIFIENSEVKNLNYLKLYDVDNPDYDTGVMEFSSMFTISSKMFKNICGRMSDIDSETIEIKTVNNQIIFGGKGEVGNTEIILSWNADGTSSNDTPNAVSFAKKSDENIVVQGEFSRDYLKRFAKAEGVANVVLMGLENDQPLMLEYIVSDLGKLRFCLVPKIDAE